MSISPGALRSVRRLPRRSPSGEGGWCTRAAARHAKNIENNPMQSIIPTIATGHARACAGQTRRNWGHRRFFPAHAENLFHVKQNGNIARRPATSLWRICRADWSRSGSRTARPHRRNPPSRERRRIAIRPAGHSAPLAASPTHLPKQTIPCASKIHLMRRPPFACACPSVRQVEPDMKFAQLLRRDLRRRPHQQVLGPLVHREQNHFAQVLLAA